MPPGDLNAAAIDRTVHVLRDFRRLMDEAGVTTGRLVTTSAVRDARNGDVFRQAALEATGLPAELLSGEEEGQLAYAGATAGLPPIDGDDLVVDIGGGSTELVVQRQGVVQAFSMNIGCVRLSERFLTHDPPGEDGDRRHRRPSSTAAIDGAVRDCPSSRPCETVSTRGRGRERHHPGRAVRWVCRPTTATGSITSVLSQGGGGSTGARRWRRRTPPAGPSAPGMVAGRADVIVGGAYVLRQVMESFGFDRCIASETDILDGIALQLVAMTPAAISDCDWYSGPGAEGRWRARRAEGQTRITLCTSATIGLLKLDTESSQDRDEGRPESIEICLRLPRYRRPAPHRWTRRATWRERSRGRSAHRRASSCVDRTLSYVLRRECRGERSRSRVPCCTSPLPALIDAICPVEMSP